jgi:hypothetical protein
MNCRAISKARLGRVSSLADRIETAPPANLVDLTAQLRTHASDVEGSYHSNSHEILNALAD